MSDKGHVKLDIKGVAKTFGTVRALEQANLSVGGGEFVSLIGPSGCGKSTLLEIVAGLADPDGGTVFLDGRNITGQKGHVAYMPQKDVLFPWRTILDNVAVPLEIAGTDRRKARSEAREWLPIFGLEEFAGHYPDQLSGGMRQRAALLRTYLCKRDVMLLDEPFASLDALTRLQMQRWLLEIWQRHRQSLLLITHDIEEAIFLSDRIYVMSARPGKVVREFEVGLARPRRPEINTSAEFVRLKSTLLQALEGVN